MKISESMTDTFTDKPETGSEAGVRDRRARLSGSGDFSELGTEFDEGSDYQSRPSRADIWAATDTVVREIREARAQSASEELVREAVSMLRRRGSLGRYQAVVISVGAVISGGFLGVGAVSYVVDGLVHPLYWISLALAVSPAWLNEISKLGD